MLVEESCVVIIIIIIPMSSTCCTLSNIALDYSIFHAPIVRVALSKFTPTLTIRLPSD